MVDTYSKATTRIEKPTDLKVVKLKESIILDISRDKPFILSRASMTKQTGVPLFLPFLLAFRGHFLEGKKVASRFACIDIIFFDKVLDSAPVL